MRKNVGVRELRNSLSRYLRMVRRGASVVILDRGVPVAVLTALGPEESPARTMAEHLARLAARGLVRLPTGKRTRPPRRFPRIDLTSAILEDREDRV